MCTARRPTTFGTRKVVLLFAIGAYYLPVVTRNPGGGTEPVTSPVALPDRITVANLAAEPVTGPDEPLVVGLLAWLQEAASPLGLWSS